MKDEYLTQFKEVNELLMLAQSNIQKAQICIGWAKSKDIINPAMRKSLDLIQKSIGDPIHQIQNVIDSLKEGKQ